MNKLCKQYIKNVKSFFPYISKKEKNYFKSLEQSVNDYCEENCVTSIEELYNGFGIPSEVVNSYYSSVNTNYILTQIQKTKILKTVLIIFICSVIVTISAYCTLLYSAYLSLKADQIFSEETLIE